MGKAIGNSFLYFIHVTTFSYGASLVEKGEMDFAQVFQVFIVINFASMSIGRSTSMLPDYNAAKAAAQRILNICERKSAIDPYDESGIKLVRIPRFSPQQREEHFVSGELLGQDRVQQC